MLSRNMFSRSSRLLHRKPHQPLIHRVPGVRFSQHTTSTANPSLFPLLQATRILGSTFPSAPPLQFSMPVDREINPEVRETFEGLTKKFETHEAFEHPLFKHMEEEAKSGKLNAKQFEIFRDAMFTRIYPTLGYVAGLAKKAAETGNRLSFVTALHNLMEEGGEAKGPAYMHPTLCEEAFNSTAYYVFGIPNKWMKNASSKRPAEVTYLDVSRGVYERFPEAASWISETGSGGNNETKKGMMGDLFGVFSALQDRFPKGEFERCVVPYFKDHVSLEKQENGRFEVIFDGSSVEFQHAERAREDAMRSFKAPEEVKRAIPDMTAFVDAQKNLFDSVLERVKEASSIEKSPSNDNNNQESTVGNFLSMVEERRNSASIHHCV